MQVRTTNLAGALDDFFNQFKATPEALAQQQATEQKLALDAGIFSNSFPVLPTGVTAGTKMQNTSDLTYDLTVSPTRTDLPNVLNFTSPVIPDFLKNATSLNTSTKVPSAGALALAMQTPWYKNRNTQLIIGGVALVAAALFVFTGNSGNKSGNRK